MEIVIPYTPREPFIPFHNSEKRWNVLICHRRAGKTVSAVNHLIRDAIRKPQGSFAYIAPYFNQAKRVAWDYAKKYSSPIPSTKFNEADLWIEYPNGSKLSLLGADNPDRLRGIGLDGVVFDEYSQQPASIFTEIVRPALMDRKGYAIWIGTPKGKNEFWRLYEKYKGNEEAYTMVLKASESGILDQRELDEAKRIMSKEEYEQEMECSFQAYIKGGYYTDELSEVRKKNRVGTVDYNLDVPVHTAWDLGISDSTAIWFYQYVGQEIHFIDCYASSGKALDHYAKVLQDKKYVYGTHHLPHDIEVRELGSGKSRYEILRSMLNGSMTVVQNLPVMDGVNAVRRMLSLAWFDATKCGEGLDALEQYRREWNDKRGDWEDKPAHDWTSHYADAIRYMAVARQPEVETTYQKPYAPPRYD